MKPILAFFFFALALLTACDQEPLDPTDYMKWMRSDESGLHVNRNIGRYEFNLQYTSPEYIVLRSNRNTVLSADEMQKQRLNFEGIEQYIFKLKANDGSMILDEGDDFIYNSRLEYFVSMAEADISLVRGTDTLACAQYNFERTYGLSPEVTLVVGFEADTSAEESDRTFIFDDHVLGIGTVKLNIEKTAYQQLPSLRYEK